MNAPADQTYVLDRSTGRSAFGAGAKGYHESRSGYPQELFDFLSQRIQPSPRILELGAGTGLASVGLLSCHPASLDIIEPDRRLCAFLRRRFDDRRIAIHSGSFPETAIDGPFDVVACAAAFHWMEPESSLARIRSILAPRGVWAMWWNCYLGHGEADPLADLAMEIFADERIALPPSFLPAGHYALDIPAQTAALRAAGFGNIEHRLYRTQRELDPQQACKLFGSFSFISVLPKAQRDSILQRISRAVAADLRGLAKTVVVTSLFVASQTLPNCD